MKLLYISAQLLREKSGGGNSARAHLNSIKKICGEDNVDVIAFSWGEMELDDTHNWVIRGYNNKLEKMMNILTGRVCCCSKKSDRKIINIIREKKYDIVFFDDGVFGSLLKEIKRKFPSIKTICYFHGVHRNSSVQLIKKDKRNILKLPSFFTKIYSEKLMADNIDILLLLNKRDENEVWRYYSRKADYYLPVYLEDIPYTPRIYGEKGIIELLFVGGYFWPNIIGIKWFVLNVMQHLPNEFHLTIVGNGMDRLNDIDIFKRDNISVFGRVESLVEFYNKADIVVGPIFDGDGMKTKTAEALLFGKTFLGTSESLCGYEELSEYECNTAEQFINRIMDYVHAGSFYNERMREIYISKYSDFSTERLFACILKGE